MTGQHTLQGVEDFETLDAQGGGKQWHSSLRHCATTQKVASLSPDEVDFFFFSLLNRSSHTMALGSTRNLPRGVKGGQHIMTTLPPSVS
jgi:hypothetical protein